MTEEFFFGPASIPWVFHWKGAPVTTIFSLNFLKLKCTKMCEFCAKLFCYREKSLAGKFCEIFLLNFNSRKVVFMWCVYCVVYVVTILQKRKSEKMYLHTIYVRNFFTKSGTPLKNKHKKIHSFLQVVTT